MGKPIGYNGSYNVGMTHYLKAMCRPLSVCLSYSAGSAIELALHSGASVWHIALSLSAGIIRE